MKSDLWHFRMPGMVYCADARFRVPVTEKAARKDVRERLDLARLPVGTEFWR